MFKFIMFLTILISTLSFASDKEFPIIYTDNFAYTVVDAKGYEAKLEKNVKGSFSGKSEDTGILDVFVIEVTMTISTEKVPEIKKEYIPKKIIVKEKGSSIEIYEEPEKIKETVIKPSDLTGSPKLKVKVKDKLYEPFRAVLIKKDDTIINLQYSKTEGKNENPIIPKNINIYDCKSIIVYYITEQRLPFIYEFGHSIRDDIFNDGIYEDYDIYKPLNPIITKTE